MKQTLPPAAQPQAVGHTRAFKAPGRKELYNTKDEVPPVGVYSDCMAWKVKELGVRSCDFGWHEPTLSRERREGEPSDRNDAGRELSHSPDNSLAKKKPIVLVDIAKQLPRPDLVKEYAACSEAISSKGFEAAYKHCAKFGKLDRQPCYSMSSLPRKDKGPASFTQPGEFNVNLDCVRPRQAADRKRAGGIFSA
ncbi:unnamed protein product [Effrenium voratum]|uniref:Uncharacterized protein n=1 Tax=Effrenium voratum TaxID=2562239 RepID=A0AA36MIQ0_9DINO|nr:unnamed protein product [Effrenium voratum]